MLLEAACDIDSVETGEQTHAPAPGCVVPLCAAQWSVIIPFYNEVDFLPDTLASLAAQTRPFRLILVDNGSTDGSAARAMACCARLGLDATLLTERRPGKVFALATGLARVATPLVATCDADTWYPCDYLAEAETLLAAPGSVAAGAFFAGRDDRVAQRRKALHISIMPKLLRRQCHTGGAGQVFRTAALRRAGGFDARRWNYVLEDHEIIHRVHGEGTMSYGARFWCAPSPRERNRESIRWTLAERIVYHAMAPIAGDWFFYHFLARRLDRRRMTSERIRERPVPALRIVDAPAAAMC
ncbi:glycosyltransferase family A protein [Sphingomonas sp. AR_OL41]|jgi:glycosyltransferase involved in cell wall biosynthesis|uniref:glycosyltransferase family 2 protein n=1 Tax=Sphingomonas sp. AR_OL41 TaxID=3042729 RepID=UPI00248163BC|nr:glycosyltransferase family A protein [Sphingomonas sp. AR_OL41]MDH7973403.1 glycosyltransferase family A protein [Sphingomonas sp. AR_OL41]